MEPDTVMFAPEQRSRLRSDLLEYAAKDPRISAAAVTGSAAAEREDMWSDIDLAFGVADAAEVERVLRLDGVDVRPARSLTSS